MPGTTKTPKMTASIYFQSSAVAVKLNFPSGVKAYQSAAAYSFVA